MALIQEVQSDEWWQDVTVAMLEAARRHLRGLVQLIEKRRRKPVYTDFEDAMGGKTAFTLPGFTVGADQPRSSPKRERFCANTSIMSPSPR
jgi:type I restriction enzyme, R subunit